MVDAALHSSSSEVTKPDLSGKHSISTVLVFVLLLCGGIGYALHSIITIIAAGRLVGFPVGEYLLGVARPLLPCIPMFLAVMGVEETLTGRMHNALVLGAEVITGAIVYIISAFILVRPAVTELIRLGKEAIGRRAKTGK